MAASGHSDLPGGQGNAFTDGATGSGQLTAIGHAESGHSETEDRDRSLRDRELPRRDR